MHRKSIKFRSGTLLAAPWKQVGTRNATGRYRETEMGATLEFLGAILVPLGRFGVPFWAQLGAKGGPKIILFGTMFEKDRKKEAPKRHRQIDGILIEFWRRNGRPRRGKIIEKPFVL